MSREPTWAILPPRPDARRVSKHRLLVHRLQAHVRAARRDSGGASPAFAGKSIALRRVEVGDRDGSLEACLDRAESSRPRRRCTRARPPARAPRTPGCTGRELPVVERCEDRFAGQGDPVFAGDVHVGSPVGGIESIATAPGETRAEFRATRPVEPDGAAFMDARCARRRFGSPHAGACGWRSWNGHIAFKRA